MATSKEIYRDYSRFYDDYTDDVTSDLEVYKSNINDDDCILEIGCGTGRITEKILEQGPKQVIGVDTSIDMLKIAQKKLKDYIEIKKLVLMEHDFTESKLDCKYNKIFVTYFTINYIINNIQDFINNASSNLEVNGEIIIDCFVPDSIINPSINNVKRYFEPFYCNGDLYYVIDQRNLENNIETRTVIFDNKLGDKVCMKATRKYYTISEMKHILSSAGFEDIKWNYGYEYQNKKICGNYLIRAKKRRC